MCYTIRELLLITREIPAATLNTRFFHFPKLFEPIYNMSTCTLSIFIMIYKSIRYTSVMASQPFWHPSNHDDLNIVYMAGRIIIWNPSLCSLAFLNHLTFDSQYDLTLLHRFLSIIITSSRNDWIGVSQSMQQLRYLCCFSISSLNLFINKSL